MTMLLHKTLALTDCEVKMTGDGGRFAGYASVFGGVDSYGDTIIKGAYEYTLKKHGKPKMFVNHDSYALPVGKWISAKEDDKGLLVEGELTPGMSAASDAYAAMKHGTIDGLSIGYALKADDFEMLDDGTRVIKRVSRLAEVSIVTFPADNAARIDLESVKAEGIEQIETARDFERFLRDSGGMSKALAIALVSRAQLVFSRRESDEDEAEKQHQIAQRIAQLTGRLHR
jgi:HK97 family phage prohead protease